MNVSQWDDGGGLPDCGHLPRHPAHTVHLAVHGQVQAGQTSHTTHSVLWVYRFKNCTLLPLSGVSNIERCPLLGEIFEKVGLKR
jgi:hypothetical protein